MDIQTEFFFISLFTGSISKRGRPTFGENRRERAGCRSLATDGKKR